MPDVLTDAEGATLHTSVYIQRHTREQEQQQQQQEQSEMTGRARLSWVVAHMRACAYGS